MVRFRSVAIVFAALSTLAAFFGAFAAHSRTGPAGVPNFGRVTSTLYRGAQPSEEGFRALRDMGVTVDVNFRDGEMSAEEHEVEALGMKYVGIPWKASQEPSTDQVVEFLDLVRANPQAKIFVHCKRGADRTGTMIAAYRVVLEHEPTTDADLEMRSYHYAHFWLPQLQRYVDSLPKLLQTDPRFTPFVTAASPAPASGVPVAFSFAPSIH